MTFDAAQPWLATRARLAGDAEAIRFGGDVVPWNALASEAEAVAESLASLGVSRGDIVAVHMAPHPRFVAILHALQMLGAALLPLNRRLARPELERILAHATPRLFLVDEAVDEAVVPPGLRTLHAFDDLGRAAARKAFTLPTRIDPEAALTIVYTSGTTAAPKGVVLTNANHAASAAASRLRLGHGAADTWLATLPLFHVGGLAILARAVLEGSSIELEAGFDVERAVEVLEQGRATMISVVPTMLARVLDRMTTAASGRVRCVLVGGAALPAALGRRALDAGLPLSATWGMTEACSQICSTRPGSAEAARGLVGRPLEGTGIRVDGADDEGWGEVLVRGAGVMRGYLRNPEADRRALDRGWLRSGDIGRIDEDGVLALSGRRDDLIVTGGENVAPTEVEHVLDEHPDVVESLVVGVADAQWGESLVAEVVCAGGRGPDADALRHWCRQRLAAYKVPREFRFVEALPRGATGKVLRPRPPRGS